MTKGPDWDHPGFNLGEDTDKSGISVDVFPKNLERALRAGRPSCPEPSGSMEGKTLAGGRIHVGRRIGGGAMGTVYEAVDQDRPVAIKVLNPVHDLLVYRLKIEFRTLKGLAHPNVISVYELFREDDNWFFTMERINGLTLHRFLEARRLSYRGQDQATREADLRSLLRQLIHGIVAIHAAGLVHRDLKPSNVLVSHDNRLVILDFGLVSEALPGGMGQTVDHRVAGTVGYMAPEQLRGATARSASDWYAFGAIVYQLLNGRPPPLPVLNPSGPPQPHSAGVVSRIDERAPNDLLSLCTRLLAHHPADRPADAEMMSLCADWESSEHIIQVSLPAPDSQEFIGRESIIDQLNELHGKSRAGLAQIGFLYGPCGIGKSALLAQFVNELRSGGAVVLEGRCSEWESVPYKGLDGVIDRFSRLLLRMSPEQAAHLVPRHVSAVLRLFPALHRVEAFGEAARASSDEGEGEWAIRLRAVAGLKDMFFRLSEQHSLVVIVDDLQWADSNTVQLLGELMAAPDPPKMLLLLSARADDDASERLIAPLSRAAAVTSIPVGPLAPTDSHALALALLTQHSATPDPALVDRIVRESAGLPVNILEFAHELNLSRDDHERTSLSHVFLARVQCLSEHARALLELVAVAVRPVTLRIATDYGTVDLQNSLRQLMGQRLVRSVALGRAECGFETYSEQVRQVVLHAMPEERIIRGHERLVHVLESLEDVEPQWLLSHYRGSGSHARAKEYSIIMAKRASAALAFDQAASMYMAALELTSEHSADWVRLNVQCAESLTNAGRGAEAARAYERAARSKPDQYLHLLTLAVEQWIRSGHFEEGVKLLRTTLNAVGIAWPELTVSTTLQLLFRRATIRVRGLACDIRSESEVPSTSLEKIDALRPAQTVLGTFDYLRGAMFAAVALPLALKAGEPKRLLLALTSEAIYAAMLGGERAEPRTRKIQAHIHLVITAGSDPYGRAMPSVALALSAYWMGRWKDVLVPASQAERILRQDVPGALWEISLLRSVRHTVMLHGGQQRALAAELPEQLKHALMRDDQYAYLDLLRRTVSTHLMRDDTSHALRTLQDLSAARLRRAFLALDHLIMSSVVATHLYNGDVSTARAELASRWKACRTMGMDRLPLVRLSVIGMEGDCLAADSDMPASKRVQSLTALAKSAADEPVAWAKSLHHALLGAACEVRGENSQAWMELNLAAEGFDAAGLSTAATAARWEAARLQGAVPGAESPPSTIDYDEQLCACGIQNRARWVRIAHTLY